MSSPSPSTKRNGACMCGTSHGGSEALGSGMSCGPRKPRKYVYGNASPGIEMNSPSPIWNAVGIPSATDLDPSSRDRFGCGHSDDSESTSAQAGNIIGDALVRLLDRHGGASEEIV